VFRNIPNKERTMIRYARVAAVGLGMCLIAAGGAEGAWGDKPKQKPQAAPPVVDPAAAAAERGKEQARIMREWQQKLEGSRWELEVLVSKPGQPAVVESDVLTFKGGSIGSEVLAKAGYDRASYSLYPPTGDTIGWEAMQRMSKDGAEETAIWRAEVSGGAMQGMLMRKRVKGDQETVDNFSFTGKKAAAPAPEPPPAPAAEEPLAQPPDVPLTESPAVR
jgi:hypothetical protein